MIFYLKNVTNLITLRFVLRGCRGEGEKTTKIKLIPLDSYEDKTTFFLPKLFPIILDGLFYFWV
jgi:hypothetical protein